MEFDFGTLMDDLAAEAAAPKYFGPFTGKGGQDMARDAARAAGVAVPLLLFVDRREFYAFDGPERRATFLEKNKARELMERISGSRPFRPVLDVDGPPSLTAEDVDTIREAWTAAAVDIGVPVDQASPLCLWAPRADKLSVHMVADWWQVPDGPAGKAFAKAVQRHSPPRLQEFIDVGASGCSTTGTFGMRLPWGLKLNKDGRGSIEGSYLQPENFGWWGSEVSPWCLQGEDDGEVYAGAIVPVAEPSVDENFGSLPAQPTEYVAANWSTGASTRAVTRVLPDDLAKFAVRIATALPYLVLDASASAGSLMSFTRKHPARCSTCERIHEREGAYVTECDGVLYLNCRKAEDGDFALMVHQTGQSLMITDKYECVEVADEYACQRFNSEAFADYVPKFVEGCDIYLWAPWKTGKTRWAGMLIKSLPAGSRVLILSCRKSLSTALSAEFGATDYRTIKGDFNDDAIGRHPISIWQIDSLKRIPGGVKPFDMILIDEPAALLAHVNQTRAGHQSRVGISRARLLIHRAARIYVSDNDLSTAHVEAFKIIRQGKRAYTLVNSFESWKDVPVEVITGAYGEHTLRFKLFEFLDQQQAARKGGRKWSGAVVPCHSRKVANGLASDARGRYGDEFVKLYTGETDDEIKATDFRDPVSAWEGAAVVIYTGTVSVGVSANTDHISNAFGFFTSGNAGALQSAQMIFRCRRLTRIAMHYGGSIVYGLPQTSEALFKWATLAKNRYVIPEGFRNDSTPLAFGPTHEDPQALTDVIMQTFEGRGWVCDALERYRSANDFVRRIVRTMKSAGCIITMSTPVKDMQVQRVGELGILHTRQAALERNQMAAEAYTETLDGYKQGSDEDTRAKLKTEKEHQGDRAVFAVRAYVDGGGMSFEDVEAIGVEDRTTWIGHHAKPKSVEAYKRLAAIVRKCDGYRGPLATGETQTAVRSDGEASQLVRKVVSALNLDDIVQAGGSSSIAVDVFKEPAEGLMDAIEEVNLHAQRLFGDNHSARRAKALKDGIRPLTVAATLNAALRFIGMALKPLYRSKWTRKEGKPYAYETAWIWSDNAPEPHPKHPCTRIWYEEAPDLGNLADDLAEVLAEWN